LITIDPLPPARRLAVEYRKATGQPLAITGEIARQDAARLLGLEVVQAPDAGYDAVGTEGPWAGRRFQIKGRAILDERKGGQRIGQLKMEQPWDSVLLVLMDEAFEPFEIYEAERDELMADLEQKNNSRRSKRGAMSVARFRNVGRLVWTREEGRIDDELWTHPGT